MPPPALPSPSGLSPEGGRGKRVSGGLSFPAPFEFGSDVFPVPGEAVPGALPEPDEPCPDPDDGLELEPGVL